MEIWLRSKLFRVSGLDAGEISAKIMAECRSGGDFLRIVMGEVARKQGVGRWADCTPEHLLYMRRSSDRYRMRCSSTSFVTAAMSLFLRQARVVLSAAVGPRRTTRGRGIVLGMGREQRARARTKSRSGLPGSAL